MSAVSQNISKMRLRRKLTQNELAEKLSVTGEIVDSWEKGEEEPDIDMLVYIAEVLHTDVSALVDSPSTSSIRKKKIINLVIACGILIIIGVIAAVLTPIATRAKQMNFDLTLYFVVRFYVNPALYLVLGWTFMQVLNVLDIARPSRFQYGKQLFVTVLIIVALYAILLLPFILDSLYNTLQMLDFTRHPENYMNELESTSHIPDIFGTIMFFVARYINPVMFFVPGSILWICKPLKR